MKKENKDLATINKLFAKLTKTHEEYMDLCLDEAANACVKLESSRKELKSIHSRINLLLKAHPGEFKFDTVSGEYFPAVNNGKQVYRVKICRQLSKVVEVVAASEKEALKISKKIQWGRSKELDTPEVSDSVEIVSQNV